MTSGAKGLDQLLRSLSTVFSDGNLLAAEDWALQHGPLGEKFLKLLEGLSQSTELEASEEPGLLWEYSLARLAKIRVQHEKHQGQPKAVEADLLVSLVARCATIITQLEQDERGLLTARGVRW